MMVRPARKDDAEAIARILNAGIAERVATLETHEQSAEEVRAVLERDLVLVAERDGEVIAWAKAGPYSDGHDYYEGVREVTVYVDRPARRAGAAAALLRELEGAASEQGRHKLLAKVFTTNASSIALFRSLGWREVGVHERHGRLDGEWKDVVVLERLLEGDVLG